jgi:hypothetical protein
MVELVVVEVDGGLVARTELVEAQTSSLKTFKQEQVVALLGLV